MRDSHATRASEPVRQAPASVMVTALPLVPAVNIRGDGDDFHTAFERVVGIALPRRANQFVEGAGRIAIWLGPDEWLLLGRSGEAGDTEAALGDSIRQPRAAFTDVTGNRVTLRVAGAGARDLLSAGCPIDLHPRAFRPGQCAQTLLGRTGIILLQRDEAPIFDILVRRSFARYLRGWLASVADLARPR